MAGYDRRLMPRRREQAGTAKGRQRSKDRREPEVVYEDDLLLVANKPAGLLTVPLERRGSTRSLQGLLTERFPWRRRQRLFVVHRIDEDSSGLVVFAKDARTQQDLKEQFKRREPERVYRAVVYGHPGPESGTWRDYLVWDTKALIQKKTHAADPRGIEAICDYRVLDMFDETSLIEIRLRTGRRNQIRLQAQLRGHTLVGEKRYRSDADEHRPVTFGRHALHAYRLTFAHPLDGRELALEAPLPADFLDLLARLSRRRARKG
jgi:23S rRNA pseudouridine1911/1915/1917 synthase